ncbi:MAG: AarF/ABC1/UbiB kinase family protein [Pirellulaceae bacterium]|nr:AarF/ABC1/UbiB kinase family protein [Planctomycetales bacterium]
MRLSSIPQLYRNLNRGTEIVSVMSKYGLADWLSRLNLDFAKGLLKDRDGAVLARQSRETRIRLALSELGPTFIKLGQLLSTRPDLVGRELSDELRMLQTQITPDPPTVVRTIVEEELGQPIDQLFLRFEDEPVAAASIGQVHRATLRTGEAVVVKVQRSGIAEKVRRDVDVMSGLAQMAEAIPELATYRPVATLAEFQRTLLRELDFGREERNLQQFAARFAGNEFVRVPQPFSELCTPRVLTMECIEGIKLTEVAHLDPLENDLAAIARRGAEIYMDMIFVDGFYHADPHPGNLVILPGGVIGLLDFGMVGRVDEQLREDIEEMMLAIFQNDPSHLAAVMMRVGHAPTTLDQAALRGDISDFVSHYAAQQVGAVDVGKALTEMSEMIFRYRIVLPPQVGMLIKTLVTLEGTAKLLKPEFSIFEVLKPLQRRAMLRRFSPARRIKKMRRIYLELEQLATILPRRATEILDQIQAGKFDVHLDHRGLGPSVNRLVLGMLASALFLGSSLLLSRNVPPLMFPEETWFGLHRVSILGMTGFMTSLLLGLRLLRAIGKSGHLDRNE